MLMEIIRILPIGCLMLGILHLLTMHLLTDNTAKQFSATARFWILVSLFCSIAFYHYPLAPAYFNNDSHTLLFILCINFFIYIMFALSTTWFTTQNETGVKYYTLVMTANICYLVLIPATNIYIIFLCFIGITIINNSLVNLNKKKEDFKRKWFRVSLSMFVLSCAIIGWYVLTKDNGSIKAISKYFSSNKGNIKAFLIACGIIIPVFCELGLVPFHLKTEENISNSILPVGHYLSVVQPMVWWQVIIKLTHVLQPAYQNSLSTIYEIIALLSVLTGAVGANFKGNLQRMFVYGSLYFLGCSLLLLAQFQKEAEFSAFLVVIIYVLNLNGLYAIRYNIKSHGTYLNIVSSLSGLSQTRPQLTFLLLICIFSLLGFPPLVGFLGEMNTLYYLITYEKYLSLLIISISLLWMAKAYLEIIRNIYSKQKFKNFDTENKYVMLFTILICSIILLLPFNPGNILEKMKDMYDVIWL